MHEVDLIGGIEFLLSHPDITGAVNFAAPNPVRNADWMRAFRERFGPGIGLPAAKWMLELGAFALRTETELLLKSRRVVPGRLLEAGYRFRFPELGAALEDLRTNRSLAAGEVV
jgi:NAD dependent epimerase/dehydratase family enzyme